LIDASYQEGRKIMDVFDAVRTLLAARTYQDKPVPAPLIHRILEAGRLTASAENKQPWHFVVVEESDILTQLGKLVGSSPYIAQAPLAIVTVIERTPYAVSDASRAIQSMMLAAWAEGVGGNWSGFLNLAGVKALLGIPEKLDVLAVLPFGYPAESIGKGEKARKPLDEIAYRGRWGAPFV